MKLWPKIAALLCIVAFVFIFGLVCWPMTLVIRLVSWRRPSSPVTQSRSRSRVARCAHWWGAVVFAIVKRLLCLKVTFAVDGDLELIRDRACIVISNHQSTLDIAVITWLLVRLGLTNGRWIMKIALRSVPVIGGIADHIGCAFVARNRSSNDIFCIQECARIVAQDNASVVLFPEGGRFRSSEDAGFSHVMRPKRTGFIVLRSMLKNAAVANVTLQWKTPVVDGTRGKTISQIGDFYGKSLHISVSLVASTEIRGSVDWLMDEWRAKDRLLASGGSRA